MPNKSKRAWTMSLSSQTSLTMCKMNTILILMIITLNMSQSSSSPLPFTKIFAFGDSFTDTGNTHSGGGPTGFDYVSNLPYGMTFFHHPTNRYSDGRLVIDFVASSLSLHYLPPYQHIKRGSKKAIASSTSGVNFAVAGSTAIEYDFFEKNNMSLDGVPVSIGTQLEWFLEYAKKQGCENGWAQGDKCMRLFDNALFWVGEIGANDYAYSVGSSVPENVVQDLAINRITAFLQVILDKYAKYVVVQGLPPTGCLPVALTLAPSDDRDDLHCVKTANQRSQTHNAILRDKITTLRKGHNHTVVLYADYWGAYETVMKNPLKYGFTEPFKACCGSGGEPYNYIPFEVCGSPSSGVCTHPSKYINWDGVHLTEAMYMVMADAFLHRNYTHPSFDYLLMRRKNHHHG